MMKSKSFGTWLVVAFISIGVGQAACGPSPDDEYDDARQGEENDEITDKSTVSIICHPFAVPTLPIIQSWIGDCCIFNGKHGVVQATSDPTKMKCKT